MSNLDSTRVKLKVASNIPSEPYVRKYNRSLKGFTNGWEVIRRRCQVAKDNFVQSKRYSEYCRIASAWKSKVLCILHRTVRKISARVERNRT